eukprot:CAMPEP_0115328366 /NCGR_PEP_ID=MMETSP0270-20121206/84644_1 /TAXON_ID=71861 /ORGANISM="Scrippsiella trochoidea, Strain CCMP3099" /LENGTH=365 /DNA_ID=CAMNT_0002748887 /DNA_START=81 /DNA_END=1177 /DNA_ORIENTATION=-
MFTIAYMWFFVLQVLALLEPAIAMKEQRASEAAAAAADPPRDTTSATKEPSTTAVPAAEAEDCSWEEEMDSEEAMNDHSCRPDVPSPAAAASLPAPSSSSASSSSSSATRLPSAKEALAAAVTSHMPQAALGAPTKGEEESRACQAPAAAASARHSGTRDDDDAFSDVSEDEAAQEERRRRDVDALADPVRAQELKQYGNALFKSGKFHDAREAYSEALHLMPSTETKDKATLHSNRAACFQKLGRWEDVLTDCKAAIDLDPDYVEGLLATQYCFRFEKLEHWHDALKDLEKAIELDSSVRSHEYKRQAFLEKRSAEQLEKDKADIVPKLTELANKFLNMFGMSTDNFKLNEDPDTGGYSIKYQN